MTARTIKPSTAVIVGGSLTGLAAAIALARVGVKVTVLEQTLLHERAGTGLGVDRELLANVVGVDPRTDDEQPHLPVVTTTRESSTWQAIRQWLLALVQRVDGVTIQEGVQVHSVTQDAHGASALTASETFRGDLLIGADGYRSIVRRAVDPDNPHATFGGFIIWRGLVGEEMLSGSSAPDRLFGGRLPDAEVARLVMYHVPGADGSTRKGERQITFAWYDAAHTSWLRAQRILEGHEVLRSIDASSIDKPLRDELRAAAHRAWNGGPLATVREAIDRGLLFGTPLTEYYPQRLARGRLAIIGDAAHVASPMVGHGLALGWLDAQALASAVARAGEASAHALAIYERARLARVQEHVSDSLSATRMLLASIAQRRVVG